MTALIQVSTQPAGCAHDKARSSAMAGLEIEAKTVTARLQAGGVTQENGRQGGHDLTPAGKTPASSTRLETSARGERDRSSSRE